MRGHIDCGGFFKVGDPCPDGYGARIDWFEVHEKAGLKQEYCGWCCRWHFPHELSPKVHELKAFSIKKGKRVEVVVKYRICLECEKKEAD